MLLNLLSMLLLPALLQLLKVGLAYHHSNWDHVVFKPSVSSPLLMCKKDLLNILQSSLHQIHLPCAKSACAIFSDLLSAKNLFDDIEVGIKSLWFCLS